MKILGASNNEDYIVQLTKEELANILGFYSKYDVEFARIVKEALKGKPIPISLIYRNYWKVKSIVESSEYSKAKSKLQEMIDAIEPIDELISELKKEYETNKA